MKRLKPLRVSQLEKDGYKILDVIKDKYSVHIVEKIGLRDVFQVQNSGINNELYEYALMAHFDAVIYNYEKLEPNEPLFAIEFDENHERYPDSIKRDKKKDQLCEIFELPLLRINKKFCYEKIGKMSSIMLWLIEIFFLEKEFLAMQKRGEILPDEFFIWSNFLNDEIDPFKAYRIFLIQKNREGKCATRTCRAITATHPVTSNIHCLGILYVKPFEITIIGEAVIRSSVNFTAVSSYELAQELAAVDAARKLSDYLESNYLPSSYEEAERKILEVFNYKDVCETGLSGEFYKNCKHWLNLN